MKANHHRFGNLLREPWRKLWKELAFIFHLCQYLRKWHFIFSPSCAEELQIWHRRQTFPAPFPNANLAASAKRTSPPSAGHFSDACQEGIIRLCSWVLKDHGLSHFPGKCEPKKKKNRKKNFFPSQGSVKRFQNLMQC